MVQAVLDDWHNAPIDEKLRMTLGLLEKVTLSPAKVSSADIDPLLQAGISKHAIEDALLVCACFNIISRIADALDVAVPSAEEFTLTGVRLLEHGYL